MDNESEIYKKVSYVEEEPLAYDASKDFTSLKAWKKARKVKLFCYDSIIPQLPKKSCTHYHHKFEEQL